MFEISNENILIYLCFKTTLFANPVQHTVCINVLLLIIFKMEQIV